jgi:hypothetical protein
MLEDLEDHVMVVVEEAFLLQILVELLRDLLHLVELILVQVEEHQIQMVVVVEMVDLVL